MSDDDAGVVARLEREYDLADRRRDLRAAGRVAWELGQIAKRDGRMQDHFLWTNVAYVNFELSDARTEELTALVELLALPPHSISTVQRGEVLHAAWVFVTRYKRDRAQIARAEADVMDWIRRAPDGERLRAEYFRAFLSWFRNDANAVQMFETLALEAPSSMNTDDHRFSQESLSVQAMRVAFQLGDLEAGQRIRLRFNSAASRIDFSAQDQAHWCLGEKWVRYAVTPGDSTRRRYLDELSKFPSAEERWLSALLRFLTSRAPMRDRIATFKEDLRRSRPVKTFFGRWRLRRIVASFAVNCVLLTRGRPPVSFDSRLPEAFAGLAEDTTASEAAAWLVFAHRAVAALARSAAVMDERFDTTNFSARAAPLVEALAALDIQTNHSDP